MVEQGDTLPITLDGASLLPKNLQVNTTYNGDAVTVSATFMTMRSGLNYAQYVTVEVPSKGISVMIHNDDYSSNS